MWADQAVLGKRKRSFSDACEADGKRQRADERTARHAARDQFWDTLSKIWLTARALREIDRRNALRDREHIDVGHWACKKSPIDISPLRVEVLKNLKTFARQGGPSLTELRNCPEPSRSFPHTMSSRGSSSYRQKQSSKSNNTFNTSCLGETLKSSAYDRDFEQKCIDHGIHMPSQRNKPSNWQELQDVLANPRRSLSPPKFSDGAFDRFCEAEAETRDENDIVTDTLPTILGKRQRDYFSAGNLLFKNMEDMVPNVFKKPKPDLYWGAQPKQIDPQVRQTLNHQIVPSTKNIYPAAPNFFLEVKDPDGSAAKKTRQACYIGAMGARAMQALQGYGQAELTYDNKAYTISSTYYDGTLKLYSHHPAQPLRPGEPARYYMTPLRGWLLTNSPQSFRQGVGAFRNARDLAREQREWLMDQANTIAQMQSADTMSFGDPNS